jgi:hypothetical protein
VPQNPLEEHIRIWDLATRNLESIGHVGEAVKLLEYIVKVRETTLRETSPLQLHSQYTLAYTYDADRQIKEAIALVKHVVKIQKTTLAETHPDQLLSQQVPASAYPGEWAADKRGRGTTGGPCQSPGDCAGGDSPRLLAVRGLERVLTYLQSRLEWQTTLYNPLFLLLISQFLCFIRVF